MTNLIDSYKLTDITNIQDVDLISYLEDMGHSDSKFYVCYDGTIEHYFITGMRNGSFELYHRNYDEDCDTTVSDEFVDFVFSSLIRPQLDNGLTTRIIALDSHIKQYHRLATDIGKGYSYDVSPYHKQDDGTYVFSIGKAKMKSTVRIPSHK